LDDIKKIEHYRTDFTPNVPAPNMPIYFCVFN
jgi:hypothetical protein